MGKIIVGAVGKVSCLDRAVRDRNCLKAFLVEKAVKMASRLRLIDGEGIDSSFKFKSAFLYPVYGEENGHSVEIGIVKRL